MTTDDFRDRTDSSLGGPSVDVLAVFAGLRPEVEAASPDELAEMRRAAFAVRSPHHPLGAIDEPQLVVPLAIADRRRLRLGVALGSAAAIVALLVIARGPDHGTPRVGPGTTGAAAATTTTVPTSNQSTATSAVTPTTTTPAGTTPAGTTPASTTTPLVLPNERIDPLMAFFSGTENGARLRERTIAGQPFIADCMRSRGWAYTQLTIRDVYDPVTLLRSRDPDEFRRRYGYGATTITTVLGYGGDRDPNQAYLATLTDEQAAAWRADLEVGDPNAPPPLRPSCWQLAFDGLAAAGVSGLPKEVELAALDPRNDPSKDARVTTATEAWRTCLARAGYNVRTLESPQTILQRKLDVLVRTANQAWDPSSNELPSISPANIASLQDEERVLAAADQRCNLEVGLATAQLRASTEIAAALRDRFPDVVVEPYDPNLG